MAQEIKFENWELEYFHDETLMKIFTLMNEFPKSTKKISEDTGIPLTTVYRKIKKLREKNLVDISGEISDDGRRKSLYSKHD